MNHLYASILWFCSLHVPKYKASIFKVKSTSFLNILLTQTAWYPCHSQQLIFNKKSKNTFVTNSFPQSKQLFLLFVVSALMKLLVQQLCFLRFHLPLLFQLLVPLERVVTHTAIWKGTQHLTFKAEVSRWVSIFHFSCEIQWLQ